MCFIHFHHGGSSCRNYYHFLLYYSLFCPFSADGDRTSAKKRPVQGTENVRKTAKMNGASVMKAILQAGWTAF